MRVGFDAAFFDPVLNIGLDPVLDPAADAFAADDHGHFRSFAPGLQGRIYGGIAGSYHNDFLHGIEMGVFIVVDYFREVFTGYIQQDREVVKTGGDDDMAGGIGPAGTGDLEFAVDGPDRQNLFLEVKVQTMGYGHTAIVFQGFGTDGLDIIAYKGNTSYLYALRRGKKGHIGRVIVQGVDQAAFFQDEIGQAGTLGLQAAGDADGASADDDDVIVSAHGCFPRRKGKTLPERMIYVHSLPKNSHMDALYHYWWIIIVIAFVFSGLVTVNQGYINVLTMFGKYQRILKPGLSFKIPFLEQIYKRISIQNRSVELEFQAVTADQANVYFKSMLLYAVQNADEETIKRVAFKFISDRDLMQALTRTIEGSIRSFVATKRQAEILGLRKEIVEFVKDQIDHSLEEWGYHLLDLQINDITFDQAIIDSMSKVVASNNLKAAAENEGQALLITKTKAAEAEGNAIKISAEAEKEAARLRGQGVALFRQEVAHGMSEAAEEMKRANLDTNVILFSMWTEAIKNFAEVGKGNIIFLDGSSEGMQNTMKQIQALMVKQSQ